MHLAAFREWIHHIYVTQDEELDCAALIELIPQYVEAEIARVDADLRFQAVVYHLSQCPECYDLYTTLREAALLESHEPDLETSPSLAAAICREKLDSLQRQAVEAYSPPA